MASKILQCLCWSLFVLASVATASRVISDAPMRVRHEQWMSRYGRMYKDAVEKDRRFKIFKDNVEYMESFNKVGNRKYRLDINQFTDLTNDEFKATYNGFKPSSVTKARGSTFRYENVSAVPSSMDWRTKGAVTPIKYQGECGCCWAFSAVAATEGITKITKGKLIPLSEHEIVDCDVNGEDHGCQGGEADGAFQFIIDNGGLTTEASYPYQGADGSCSTDNSAAATIRGYEDVPSNSEWSLLKAVAQQPVSVAIDASGFNFQHYSGGLFDGECGTELDHVVTAVGYDTDSDGTKYWLVKNSWGTDWGEEGYMRMERDISDAQGLCGIAMQASYPTA